MRWSTRRRARPLKPNAWPASWKSSRTRRGGSITGRGASCGIFIPKPTCRCFRSASTQAAACRATSNSAASLPGLRDRGVLILGSGNIVHNLRRMEGEKNAQPFPWTVEFDSQVKKAIETRDLASLAAPEHWGKPLAALAHPTLEHYVPLLYCLGSTTEHDAVSYPYEGFEYGSLSMRMVLFGGE